MQIAHPPRNSAHWVLALAAAFAISAGAAKAPKPHIVVMLADDYGWANLGVHRVNDTAPGPATRVCMHVSLHIYSMVCTGLDSEKAPKDVHAANPARMTHVYTHGTSPRTSLYTRLCALLQARRPACLYACLHTGAEQARKEEQTANLDAVIADGVLLERHYAYQKIYK